MIFVGDTMFAMGCGRLFEGTAEQMHATLQRLAALPDDVALYCGHEYTLANARFAAHAEPGNRGDRRAAGGGRRDARARRDHLADDGRRGARDQPVRARRRRRRIRAAADGQRQLRVKRSSALMRYSGATSRRIDMRILLIAC